MFFKSKDNGNSQPKWKWVAKALQKKKKVGQQREKITIHKWKNVKKKNTHTRSQYVWML